MEKRQRKRFQHRNIDEGQMKDPNPLSDQNPAPEDVATLYSWANLHGAKYRDFSAARAQTREKTRLQMQEMRDEQERKTQQEAEALRAEQAGQAHQPAEISNQIEAPEIQAASFFPAGTAGP